MHHHDYKGKSKEDTLKIFNPSTCYFIKSLCWSFTKFCISQAIYFSEENCMILIHNERDQLLLRSGQYIVQVLANFLYRGNHSTIY